MSVHIVRLPDVGEGVAEAELVAWHVAVGDRVTSDTVVAEVLTDKSTVEIYAPVAGTIAVLHGEAGDVLAVGGDFIAIETDASASVPAAPVAPVADAATPTNTVAPGPPIETPQVKVVGEAVVGAAVVEAAQLPQPRSAASPAVRERARALGVELSDINGSGPDGRVNHDDLDRHLLRATPAARSGDRAAATTTGTKQIPLIGLRRKIADHLTTASSRIPHITYVDEIDMTQLLHLRESLATAHADQPRVSVLPFVMHAIVLAVADQPQLNATFDDEAETLTTYSAVHIGIATQTPNGLIVPVVRDAQDLDLWGSAAELARVTGAARNGTAGRTELAGSTITITSLGALGGLVTTPIINHPEVAIVGINKLQTRPMWDGSSFVPRSMMNLSSSFDHRIVDGWDAATFVQRIKTLLEEPSLLFVQAPPATPIAPSSVGED